MGRWLLMRLGGVALAAWGIASVVFLLLHLLPTGPEMPGQDEAGNPSYSVPNSRERASALAAWQHRLGLDEPVFYATRPAGRWCWHGTHNQYHHWLSQLLRGELGYSYSNSNPPVADMLGPALLQSLPLMALAVGLATAGAIGLALTLAMAPAQGWRAAVGTGLMAVQAVPLFALALGLLLLLANPDVISLPASGRALLPLVCLVLAALPELVLPLAATLRHELAADYARTARAKGLTTWQVAYRHALLNALLPLLPTFTGLLPALVAGVVVVEGTFALPGTGSVLANAAATHDYPVVVAGVLLAAIVRLLAWLLADALFFWADPRVRKQAPN